jgi:hypothetical protein
VLDNHSVELGHKTRNLFCGLLDENKESFSTILREFDINPE